MDTNDGKLQKSVKATRMVCILTFCVAAFSLAVALISMRNMRPSAYGFFDYCSFVHFGFMVLFGAMFLLKSRAFAILFLIYYILSRIVLAIMIAFSGASFTVDFFIGVAFIVVICYGLRTAVQYQNIMKGFMRELQTEVQGAKAGLAPQPWGQQEHYSGQAPQQNHYANQQQPQSREQHDQYAGQEKPWGQQAQYAGRQQPVEPHDHYAGQEQPGVQAPQSLDQQQPPQNHYANQQQYSGQQPNPHLNTSFAITKQPYNTSIVLGIVAILLFWLLGVISVALGIIGIILSLKNKDAYRTGPGFVLSIIGLILGILMALFIILART